MLHCFALSSCKYGRFKYFQILTLLASAFVKSHDIHLIVLWSGVNCTSCKCSALISLRAADQYAGLPHLLINLEKYSTPVKPGNIMEFCKK